MENDLARDNHAELSVEKRTKHFLPAAWSIASIAVASTANSQSIFARASSSTAAHGVEIVGYAIVLFTAVTSVGMLVAGLWTTLQRRAEAQGHRR